MPYQIENRMLSDSEYEGVEFLQNRVPDKPSRRLQRVLDEMEYGRMVEENE